MSYNSKIDPTEPFPEDLRQLDDRALHSLNSKVHRELDAEYAQGFPELETEFRKEEITVELDRRARGEHSFDIPGKRSRLLRAV